MWEQIQGFMMTLGAPEILILLVIIGGAIAYFTRSKRGGVTDSSRF